MLDPFPPFSCATDELISSMLLPGGLVASVSPTNTNIPHVILQDASGDCLPGTVHSNANNIRLDREP